MCVDEHGRAVVGVQVDESSTDLATQRKELDKKTKATEDSIRKLEEEQPKHAEHVKKVREYLTSIKASLFGSVANHADTVQTILQVCACMCVYTRVVTPLSLCALTAMRVPPCDADAC